MRWTADPVAAVPPDAGDPDTGDAGLADDAELADAGELADAVELPDDELLQAAVTAVRKASVAADATTRGADPLRPP
jgi:hypothetical protein